MLRNIENPLCIKLFKVCLSKQDVCRLTWQQRKSWQVDSSVQSVRHLCRLDRRLSTAAADILLKLRKRKKLCKKSNGQTFGTEYDRHLAQKDAVLSVCVTLHDTANHKFYTSDVIL